MGGPLPSAAFRRFGGKPPVGLICGRGQRREVATGERASGSAPPMRATSVERAGPTTADGCTPLHRRYSHRGRRRQPCASRFQPACDVPGGSGHFWTLLRAAMMTSPGALGLRTDGFRLDEASPIETKVPPRASARGAKLLQGSNHSRQPRAGPSAAPRKPGHGSVQACRCGSGSAANRLSLRAMPPRGTGWFRSSKGW